MVIMELTFTSLTTAQNDPVQQQKPLQSRISDIDEAISLAVDSKPEEHNG